MSTLPEILVLPDPAALFRAAADRFVEQAKAAVAARGRFTVALSGGSTPKGLFQDLAATDRGALPWNKMYFFWGDERHVPPDHPESNYRMAREALLSKVPVPAANIFRIPAEDSDASRAAATYESTLRSFFHLAAGQFPEFDLILLGMGPDGHTASLFPRTKALAERTRLVVANWVEKFKTDRITFTVPVLNEARVVEFLVAGKDKVEALHEVLEGPASPELYPSKLVQPTHGTLVWLMDQAAAAGLSRRAS
jgi:6-phosphogluconolactonase